MNNIKKTTIMSKDGVSYLIPFILITSCFALWGFANDITNPMVKAFSKIFRMSVTDGALVQVAFYGGYFLIAIPASLVIKKTSYKVAILMGLTLYIVGDILRWLFLRLCLSVNILIRRVCSWGWVCMPLALSCSFLLC